MKKNKKKSVEEIRLNEFLDKVSPSILRFKDSYFICADTYRSVWVINEYPKSTEQLALLRYLGDKENITIRIHVREVTSEEKRKILMNASNKNRMNSYASNMVDKVEAESDMQQQVQLVSDMYRTNEPLVHCAVYIELIASDLEKLKLFQAEVQSELTRSGIDIKKLTLRQREGFKCVCPAGFNALGDEFERILPASSVANLLPFNYSGKTDGHGFYLGKDKYGSNIFVDFNKRDDDKTNGNIIILGNSGQGKSYLLKLILTNLRCAGTNIICLDPEGEYKELTTALKGDYVDLMEGQYKINILEPKLWSDTEEQKEDQSAPLPFRTSARLSQHISFLKDFFKCYKDLSDKEIDVIEILLRRLYQRYGITDTTDFASKPSTEYPILSDFYELCEDEIKAMQEGQQEIFTIEMLSGVMLSLQSICIGSDSQFFNGFSNIQSRKFVTFGVKGILEANTSLRNAMLFNILSYMSNELLVRGNTCASLDEFYLFLTNITAIEYIRNFMKRVRKKDSQIILSSQNLEDFNIEGIREYTKPLFAIPTHQFLFNAGNIDKQFYINTLQLEESEFELIKQPKRGHCLYRCGNERYYLEVHAPIHKERLFGKAGGR
ncbi:VirB4 family type IV secretion system protein [Anaerorhabdus sp.]|uniref:VirB4 family type IV secretion system protein n=1 Tax=Anaerorhabdus sp. TaxID=1872524 RepID=UPI002FC9EC57